MSNARGRPNKTARGMTLTRERSHHSTSKASPEVIALAVLGTTDTLRGIHMRRQFATVSTCPCCGQAVRRYMLNNWGKNRLRILRARALARNVLAK